ncbi:Protoporphyrinogen oxidase, C-terminal domain [Ostreococcus tauri]|nr:Protoporphyrinogen oxidase, C-terminal domain [Ostreococcus tauri]CAL53621.1 Protoporphyrinogen oxidase, C-terminal domain [Ostreococcus tauri]|eukprot:XP_003079975.1 Protoporphyrinogen oxidase, C-terminal domain [Ostreococcus tauri]
MSRAQVSLAPARVADRRRVGRTRAARRAVAVRASTVERDVVIVGAGVSGLSTAFTLAKKTMPNASVMVTEARDRVGGNITSKSDGTYTWEEGPNSYQPGDAILTLACDAGMRDDILLADPASNRYVLWDGKLRILPHSIESAVLGDFLTWPGKIRAGLGAIGIRPPAPGKEESVKEFVSRNLGTEAFERLIEPFCSGVYAGDPASLSSVAATGRVQRLEPLGGSLVVGALKAQAEAAKAKKESGFKRDPRLPEVKGQTVGSFRGGLKTFPEGLAKQLGDDVVKCNWKLVNVNKAAEGGYTCEYDTPEGRRTVIAKCLLLTAPAYVTAEIVKDMAPAASTALNKFYYPPVASVTVSYKKDSFRLDGTSALPEGGLTGFGQLHPRSQGIRTLGTIYSSSLFKDDKRQPDDEFMILNYIGGARDVAIKDLSEDELVQQVHEDALKTILKPGTPLPKVVGVKLWEKAIPQFNLGHLDVLAEAENALEAAACGEKDGLFLGGNYTAGVALGRCVEFGVEQADEVATFLKSAKKLTAAV